MKDHSHASDSELVRELTTTRGALRDAIRIGETLQARIDAALELIAERPVLDRLEVIAATLRGQA